MSTQSRAPVIEPLSQNASRELAAEAVTIRTLRLDSSAARAEDSRVSGAVIRR